MQQLERSENLQKAFPDDTTEMPKQVGMQAGIHLTEEQLLVGVTASTLVLVVSA